MKVLQNRLTQKILLAVLVTVILFPLLGAIFYFYKFHGSFSLLSSDWANFSTFHGYFLGWANLIIVSLISYIAMQATNAFNRLQLKPLIYILIDKPSQVKKGFKDSWYLKNGSKNAAINVMARFTSTKTGYTKWVSCFSLSENERLELFWIQYAAEIEIAYSDMSNEKFYLFTVKDYFGTTTQISASKFDSILKNAINNRKNNYIALRDKLEIYFGSSTSIENKDNTQQDLYIDNFIKAHLFEYIEAKDERKT